MRPACAAEQAAHRHDDCVPSADPQVRGETRRQSRTSRGYSPDGAFYKQSSTGRAALYYLAEPTRSGQAPVYSLLNGMLDLFRRRAEFQRVHERPLGASHRDSINGSDFVTLEWDLERVNPYARTWTHAPLGTRDGQVNSRWDDVGEPIEFQRAFVGDHRSRRPERQPCRHNVFMRTGREVSQTIKAASDALKPTSRTRVVAEGAHGHASSSRLANGEVARLLLSDLVDFVVRRVRHIGRIIA